jgi:hypothetical protein
MQRIYHTGNTQNRSESAHVALASPTLQLPASPHLSCCSCTSSCEGPVTELRLIGAAPKPQPSHSIHTARVFQVHYAAAVTLSAAAAAAAAAAIVAVKDAGAGAAGAGRCKGWVG